MTLARRAIALLLFCVLGCAEPRFLILATTTSTHNSGLLDHVIPRFTEQSGILVRSVVAGTGQALRIGANCDADAVLVHDRVSEDRFVAEGHSSARYDVMYNDFILIGPHSDPAGISGSTDAVAALRKIAASESKFVSRGDDSGTHKAELRLWQRAATDLEAASGGWYRETGSGMGATLNAAVGMQAYTLSDRGTWISFKNRESLEIHTQGDPSLFNPYGIMPVDSERCRNARTPYAQQLVDWMTSDAGQAAIASYRLDGETLFFANAKPG
jgi:tungstate transport system substrate-binding protein